jgi:hypothetical protein
MTEFSTPDLLDGFLLPEDAILVPEEIAAESDRFEDPARSLRHCVLSALRLAMRERLLDLPLGPSLDPEDPTRLLSLNHLAVQLAITGISSDSVSFDSKPWQRTETAPQLLLVAAVDDDLRVVHIPGVLSADETIQALGHCDTATSELELPMEAFKGGIERLFTLALLVRSSALPRRSLQPTPATPLLAQVLDWCRGELTAAFDALGATLMPVGATAFRQASGDDLPPGSLAIVAVPLGLTASGELRTGEEALRCIERFRLLLIPSGEGSPGPAPRPDRLTLRLQADPVGDLLPDGVELCVFQGGRRQSLITADSTALELQLPADEAPIQITLTPPSGVALELPPVQL